MDLTPVPEHCMKSFRILSLNLVLAIAACLPGRGASLTVQLDQPGARLNPAMWGIFFEDINFGADGGLYAELVKNRHFEFPNPMLGWSEINRGKIPGTLSIQTNNPSSVANPHYLRIVTPRSAIFGVANEGFRGIGVQAGETYDFSVQIRGLEGAPVLGIELADSAGTVLASTRLEKFSRQWKTRSATLTPNATAAKAHLNLVVRGVGKLDLDMVSLFPRATWKQRPGGLRADMVQLLADMKPGFMRFPGGCIVEGNYLTNRYQWKKTIGPVAERKTMINRWNFEFKHRPTPDYYQSFGLGFFEYFQLCEDIGAQPLPILSCGLACQFNSGEACPLDQLQPFLQDALDLIEFANGPTNTTWGAKRAAMGHSEPFHLRMIGIGNENWDEPYLERYAKFHALLKQEHPEIQLISSAGPSPDDKHFKFAWPRLRELNADIVDEHCYAKPVWFFNNTRRYDDYERKGPKVFFGEYAAQSDKVVSVNNRNNLECAIAEAAFMTGLERNGEVVRMASYAPLFGHEEAWQWRPNLIWVDNLRSYGTPNYYVQKLFANHHGDFAVTCKLDAGEAQRLFASCTRDEATGELILKLVNGEDVTSDVTLNLTGEARSIVLTSASKLDENSFTEPRKVYPAESTLRLTPDSPVKLAPWSLTVLRLKISN